MPTFASFMAPLTGEIAAGFDGGPEQQVLDVNMTYQEQTNWCWAAVTQAVLRLRPGREASQEAIASKHMELTGKAYDCAGSHKDEVLENVECGNGHCQAGCNNAHLLPLIMAEQDCYGGESEGLAYFEQIQEEIGAGRPLACRVQWLPISKGGHFILISGWEIGPDNVRRIHVLDPSWNQGTTAVVKRTVAYDALAGSYSNTIGYGYVNFSYRVA